MRVLILRRTAHLIRDEATKFAMCAALSVDAHAEEVPNDSMVCLKCARRETLEILSATLKTLGVKHELGRVTVSLEMLGAEQLCLLLRPLELARVKEVAEALARATAAVRAAP